MKEQRNIKAINEYLATWKETCWRYYSDMLDKFYGELPRQQELKRQLRSYKYGTAPKSVYDDIIKELGEFNCKLERKKVVPGDYKHGYGTPYWVTGEYYPIAEFLNKGLNSKTNEFPSRTFVENLINDTLDREVAAKYDMIVERATQKVGKVVDASGLYVGDNGELNGYVKGNTGKKVKITTIGAGGYNIQCFHFRVLMNLVK